MAQSISLLMGYSTIPLAPMVLSLGTILRTTDSFKIWAEVYNLTGGGPGSTTNFMSLYTSSQAIGGADLGYGSALSMVYLYIVVIICYLLYTVMMNAGQGGSQK